jgi:FGFR1 oncogene partner
VFEAIEDEDRVAEENEDGGNPALLGSCNDRAKQLHASPSGLSPGY